MLPYPGPRYRIAFLIPKCLRAWSLFSICDNPDYVHTTLNFAGDGTFTVRPQIWNAFSLEISLAHVDVGVLSYIIVFSIRGSWTGVIQYEAHSLCLHRSAGWWLVSEADPWGGRKEIVNGGTIGWCYTTCSVCWVPSLNLIEGSLAVISRHCQLYAIWIIRLTVFFWKSFSVLMCQCMISQTAHSRFKNEAQGLSRLYPFPRDIMLVLYFTQVSHSKCSPCPHAMKKDEVSVAASDTCFSFHFF